MNSSPPNRPTMSRCRAVDARLRPISVSNWSPAAWPSVSLISLKWSTSQYSTATRRPLFSASTSTSVSRSSTSARLGSPVSLSCVAAWANWACIVRSSVMSSIWVSTRRGPARRPAARDVRLTPPPPLAAVGPVEVPLVLVTLVLGVVRGELRGRAADQVGRVPAQQPFASLVDPGDLVGLGHQRDGDRRAVEQGPEQQLGVGDQRVH